MDPVYDVFLAILQAALHGEKYSDPLLNAEQWRLVLQVAKAHEVLSLVYDSAVKCRSFFQVEYGLRSELRDQSIFSASRQAIQNNEFLTLLLHAQDKGLDPIVLKGVVVRSLYPTPILRPSVDEDLLVSPEEAERFNAFLLDEGLFRDDPEADIGTADELSYHKENSPTYIELHTSLFPQDSKAYGDCNAPFADSAKRSVHVQIEDVSVRTLAPTDHILYLILHVYKHFLHSGFGIRQIADICVFSEHYDSEIDWHHVSDELKELRILKLAGAIYLIGSKHLGFSMPAAFEGIEIDEQPLLDDILTGGLYGISDINRLHASTVTLGAVEADKTGKKRGILHSLFPSANELSGRFKYLRKAPWLLPAAWVQRDFNYLFKRGNQKKDPAESIRIGNERIELIRQYDIID